MTRAFAGLIVLGLCAVGVHTMGAQGFQPAAPAPEPVHKTADPILKSFTWRSIGPANMGGRIDDIAVVESNPSIYYVGFATGGVWKTVNNGTTFTPIFDEQPVTSIGDIAVAPSDPNVLYVGTGEPNNRQSSSFGAGVYKTTDAGKTWKNLGLKDTQSIARIVVHPKDPNVVYVAAIGHLFGPNKERGVYKTTDGGATWSLVKYIDPDVGFTDLVMDPANPNVLYGASYQRRRVPWGFNGGGPGSGIWKTVDAGKTWKKLEGGGLPEGLLGPSASTFRVRTRILFTRRWKLAQLSVPAVKSRPWVDQRQARARHRQRRRPRVRLRLQRRRRSIRRKPVSGVPTIRARRGA